MKKNAKKPIADDLRPQYTREMLGRGVRGKFASKLAKGQIVLLAPDVARAFPDATSVNQALRTVIRSSRKAG
jgi:hypothetical protein